jgi:sugar O-acyltransferase (sialic acid O-acetyltransferase NeuD family)
MSKINVVIFGAGDTGKVVFDILAMDIKYNVVGFIDKGETSIDENSVGCGVLGEEDDLVEISKEYNVHHGIISVGDNYLRQLIVRKIRKIIPPFKFINAIHPSVIISKKTQLGLGNILMPGVILNTDTVIGDFCLLNTGCSLDHDSVLKDYSSLAPGVIIGGNSIINSFAALSLGANVIHNIQIGFNSVIGAGAIVLNDIPENVIAYGSPCKVIRKRKLGDMYF